MPINTILRLFTPNTAKFHDVFDEMAAVIQTTANEFVGLCRTADDAVRKDHAIKIYNLEMEHDKFTRKIFIELGRNFITPFDREDIHYLAEAMDDICDTINLTATKIVAYQISADKYENVHYYADAVKIAADAVAEGVRSLRSIKKLDIANEQIKKIRDQHEFAYGRLLDMYQNLFKSDLAMLDIFKRKDILENFEQVIKSCMAAANTIESVVVKYA
jgi:uncharacterized protein Yka (UPF0111/DUF47 family)